LAGARAGVDILRVHDVAQTAQALSVWQAIEGGRA
jgi:dihydropteroate synthase